MDHLRRLRGDHHVVAPRQLCAEATVNRGVYGVRQQVAEVTVAAAVTVFVTLDRVVTSLGYRPARRGGEVLAAFRLVTGWPDALVRHYALDPECSCVAVCGRAEHDCVEAREIWRTSGS